MLVNNAGVGSVAPILQADVEKMDDIIRVNITALTRLTYAVAPAFVARGSGTIINIASVVGIAVENLNGVYSASKSYVISFGHSLQRASPIRGFESRPCCPCYRDRILGYRRKFGPGDWRKYDLRGRYGSCCPRGPRPG